VVFTPTDTTDCNSVPATTTVIVVSAPTATPTPTPTSTPTPNPTPSGTGPLLTDEVFLAIDLSLVLDGYPLTSSMDSAINTLFHDIVSNPTFATRKGLSLTEGVLATYGVL
jgi:hypothetical protein